MNDVEMADVSEIAEDTNRSEAKLTQFLTISELVTPYLSPPTYVRMLPWKILVVPNKLALGVFLQCNGESDQPTWSCNAAVQISLKSHKPEVEDYTRPRIVHVFNSKENDYGYKNLIFWDQLAEPNRGLLHNQGITVMIHVEADEPQIVAP